MEGGRDGALAGAARLRDASPPFSFSQIVRRRLNRPLTLAEKVRE